MEWLQRVCVLFLLACTAGKAQSDNEDAPVDIPWYVWVVIVVVAVLLILLIIFTAYFSIYNLRAFCRSSPSRQDRSKMIELDEVNGDHGLRTPDDNVNWELDRKSLTLRNQLGIGEFGPIYDAELQLGVNMMSRAVVKVFRQGTSQDLVRFRQDIEDIMCLQHPRVGRVFGVVSQAPYYLVMELTVNGDLKTLLLSASERAPDQGLSPAQLVAMATDVASGLSYMESMSYVHKDIAARNCIVMQNLSVKITDFKLGRYLHRSEYAVQNDGSLMPVRWMAPESISHNKFTAKTAVWSFGVLLWEVMGRGVFPYQELGDGDVIEAVCHTRLTLLQPPDCPDPVYREIQRCWTYAASGRPAMEDLHQTLKSSLLTNTYTI